MNQRHRLACAVLLLVGLAFAAGCTQGVRTVRCYTGQPLQPTEVARVYTTKELHVTAVDGSWVKQLTSGDSGYIVPRPKIIELTPGDHRLTIFYQRDTGSGGGYISYEVGDNLVTIRHAFEPGKEYTFATATVSTPAPRNAKPAADGTTPAGMWQPLLVDKGTKAVVARVETGNVIPITAVTPKPSPSASRGTTISGVAVLLDENGRPRTCTGRSIVLMRKTPRNVYWLEKRRWEYAHPPFISFAPITWGGLDKDARKLGARSVQGFGMGQFEIHDVPPGEYLVLFEYWNVIARTDVVVREGQARIDGVKPIVPPKPTKKPVKPGK